MNIQRDVISMVFKIIPAYIQWIFAVLVPALREMNRRVLSKLVDKMIGCDDEMANVLLNMNVNVFYAFFVAVRLSSSEIATVVCTIAVDFLLHLRITYNIVQLHKKLTSFGDIAVKQMKQKSTSQLVLAEMCEGLVPLCYAIEFAMLYYGPNSSIIGNVGSSIWGYNKVENTQHFFGVLFVLFAIDTTSAVLNGFCLWKICNIDIFQEFCRILKYYWYIMFVQLVTNVTLTLIANDINLGMDWTLGFQWTTEEGRLMLIYNSSDISEAEKASLLSNGSQS